MLTRLHKPAKRHLDEEEGDGRPSPEIVRLELELYIARSVVRLGLLAEALEVSGDCAAQIVADAMRPGDTFIGVLDQIIEDEGVEVEEAYKW